jgi:hypothetical protein
MARAKLKTSSFFLRKMAPGHAHLKPGSPLKERIALNRKQNQNRRTM